MMRLCYRRPTTSGFSFWFRSAAHSTAKLSRTHAVLQNPSGLVTIVGGKLTTYRRMAQDTVDVLSRRDGTTSMSHPTRNLPLSGSAGWPAAKSDLEAKGTALGLDPQTVAHLGESYGSHAGTLLNMIEKDAALGKRLIEDLPYLQAEVVYACRHEMAMTPDDVLARRTAVMLEDRDRGTGIVDEVAALMARELDWSPGQQKAMIDAYRTALQQQMPV
jgi:glycerol-3-phosphate dehydrogenase